MVFSLIYSLDIFLLGQLFSFHCHIPLIYFHSCRLGVYAHAYIYQMQEDTRIVASKVLQSHSRPSLTSLGTQEIQAAWIYTAFQGKKGKRRLQEKWGKLQHWTLSVMVSAVAELFWSWASWAVFAEASRQILTIALSWLTYHTLKPTWSTEEEGDEGALANDANSQNPGCNNCSFSASREGSCQV